MFHFGWIKFHRLTKKKENFKFRTKNLYFNCNTHSVDSIFSLLIVNCVHWFLTTIRIIVDKKARFKEGYITYNSTFIKKLNYVSDNQIWL